MNCLTGSKQLIIFFTHTAKTLNIVLPGFRCGDMKIKYFCGLLKLDNFRSYVLSRELELTYRHNIFNKKQQ